MTTREAHTTHGCVAIQPQHLVLAAQIPCMFLEPTHLLHTTRISSERIGKHHVLEINFPLTPSIVYSPGALACRIKSLLPICVLIICFHGFNRLVAPLLFSSVETGGTYFITSSQGPSR